MSSSIGKRQRERQKIERAQVKAERRAGRLAGGPEDIDPAAIPDRSESELIDDLRALQRASEAGEVSTEDFEVRRDSIRAALERLSS
jgi:hypothetical protein